MLEGSRKNMSACLSILWMRKTSRDIKGKQLSGKQLQKHLKLV